MRSGLIAAVLGATLAALPVRACGRGVGDFDRWFAAPGRGDFVAKDVDRIMQKGERRPEVEDDFCGRKRLGATDLGAIEYTAGKCASAAWSARLLATFN